ncbi:MAG: glycosyltransferase [Planctomycetes bacterium]|nr:glycosyltransferase [Planctomycetota bacterium]
MSGKPVDLIAISPLSGVAKGADQFPLVTRFVDLPRVDYLKVLASTHVVVNASHEEGFTIAVIEQLYSGCVVLLPRRPWVKALIRECYEDCPWRYSTQEEAYAKLKMNRRDYAAAQRAMAPVRAMIRRDYDSRRVVADTFGTIARVVDEGRAGLGMSADVHDLIRQATLGLGSMFRFSKFCETLKALARLPAQVFDRDVPVATFPGKLQVYWALQELGYVDSMDSPDPLMVKTGTTVLAARPWKGGTRYSGRDVPTGHPVTRRGSTLVDCNPLLAQSLQFARDWRETKSSVRPLREGSRPWGSSRIEAPHRRQAPISGSWWPGLGAVPGREVFLT